MTSLYSCSHCAVAAKDCCRTEIISVPLARNTLSHSLKRGVAVRSRTVQGPGLLWNSSATRATARFPQLVGIARMMRELRSPAAKPGLLSVHISRFRHRIYIAGAYKAAKVGVASGPPRVCSCRMAWHRRINGVRFVVIAHSQHRRAPRCRVMQAPLHCAGAAGIGNLCALLHRHRKKKPHRVVVGQLQNHLQVV